ncbi:hypothetical protein BKA70DRAFT_1421354 [Coprinopsis sp. MPI-PUGE-AT-0042]|nr:hypothetical protein BKA70DRAFT_1421354 [Coprinopsis sp. MPI-PUGE-AT-0042]
MRRPAWKYVLYLLAPIYLTSVSALEITLAPDGTDHPTPATTLYFNTAGTFTDGDPELVEVILRDTRRGNETRIFEHNIKAQPDLGFKLDVFPPGQGYILRLDDASSNAVAATSRPFEIYALGTPPSSTYNLQPSSAPSPSPSPSSSGEPLEDEPSESKLPLGTIIGGAVGGFAVLVLFFVLLWLLLNRREKKRSPQTLPDPNSRARKPGDKDVIAPFILPTANASHPESIPMTASTASPTRFGESAAAEKARLKARLAGQPKYFDSAESSTTRSPETVGFERAPSAGGASSSDHLLGSAHSDASHRRAPSSSKSAAIRAEQLRRERERIDQEIAQLEKSSVYSGGAAGGSKPRPSDDIRGQIASLRDQVTKMERGGAGYTPIDEPPPEYVARRSLPPAPK